MSDKPDILIIRPIPNPDAMEKLAGIARLHRLDQAEDKAARQALLDKIGPVCRIAVTAGGVGLDGISLDRLPSLGLIASYSAGYEGLNTAHLKAAGVVLTTTSNALCDDVADTALMLMLATRRDLRRADAYVRNGDWARKGMYPLQSSMKGARMGLIGAGRIGQAIARRAEAMGMKGAYYGRRKREDVDLRYEANLMTLARWADILVVAIAGGPGTYHLVNERVLAALGPRGTLINIARGSVVDEVALIEALTHGGIASAGLDVFASEPAPDPRLTKLENVHLYPHHASGTVQTRAAMGQAVLDSINAFLAGERLDDRVIL